MQDSKGNIAFHLIFCMRIYRQYVLKNANPTSTYSYVKRNSYRLYPLKIAHKKHPRLIYTSKSLSNLWSVYHFNQECFFLNYTIKFLTQRIHGMPIFIFYIILQVRLPPFPDRDVANLVPFRTWSE